MKYSFRLELFEFFNQRGPLGIKLCEFFLGFINSRFPKLL